MIAALALLASVQPASAEEGPGGALDPADLAFVTQQFDVLGIDAVHRDGLLQKIAAGEQLDAESGAAPVSESSWTVDGFTVTTARYADGSASQQRVQVAPSARNRPRVGQVTPQAMWGCTASTSGRLNYRKNCTVDYVAVTWTAQFTIDYVFSKTVAGISRATNPMNGGIGVGTPKVTILVGKAVPPATAQAQIKFRQNVNILGVPTSRDAGFVNHIHWDGRSVQKAFGL